ncbi:MAG: hypothetical protein ACFCUQ_09105 [Kiloniellales bacterium]
MAAKHGDAQRAAAKSSGLARFLNALPADVFGSDVYVDYQATYVWQANQVGHFAIGFLFGYLLLWLVEPSILWVVVLCGLYAVKELLDFLIARVQAQGWFPADQGELLTDMGTDTFFVSFGVLFAFAGALGWAYGLAVFVVGLAITFALRAYYLPGKRHFDKAVLPFYYRLPNFPRTEGVHQHNADRILAFIGQEPCNGFAAQPTVLIQGYKGTGKTTLGVAIGSELAMRRKKVLYVTAFALFEETAPTPAYQGVRRVERRVEKLLGAGDPWSLDEVDFLIIDNVDTDSPLYSSDMPEEIIAKLRARPELERLLHKVRTVWVSGSPKFATDDEQVNWQAWERALIALYDLPAPEAVATPPEKCTPREIERAEPVPIIWLRQQLKTGEAG